MSGPLLGGVVDTARWVAVYRALESERPDALFRDPYARQLAGTKGEEIVARLPRGRALAWPMIVRTAVMDEILTRTLPQVDVVLNLAAGLDTRPWRLELPASLRWFEADLPEMVRYKREALQGESPRCRLESVPVDLSSEPARRDLFARVGGAGERVLVISEGLLVYLAPDDVAGLARDLHNQASFGWWLTDLATPRLIRMLERSWGRTLRASGAPLRFAPAESTAFFEPLGWREAEFRPMFEESIRLKRSVRFAKLWQLVGRLYPKRIQEEFRRMSGIALLERAG
jgi:methyltransferase (TIGR00027 family)